MLRDSASPVCGIFLQLPIRPLPFLVLTTLLLLQVLGPPHRRASGDSGAGGRQLSGGYTLVEGGQPGARGQAAMAPQNIRSADILSLS